MHFMTPKAVCEKTAISRATLDRLVKDNRFPKPIRLTERRLAYREDEVDEWMKSIAQRA
jgi:prophage regulatory protein